MFLISIDLHGFDGKDQELLLKRVNAYLIICDAESASEEAYKALLLYPQSRTIHEVYIKSLSHTGNEESMFKAWHNYFKLFPDGYEKREVLESMAWGIIENGYRSSSQYIRLTSLLGSLFGQDARGVEVLRRGLNDSSHSVRSACVQLASYLRDDKLKDSILDLSKNDSNWKVRFECIKAIGKMKIKEAGEYLVALMGDEHSSSEEKAAALEATINMLESSSRQDVAKLVQSNRAGLRILGCRVIEHLGLNEDLDLILPLLRDSNANVREAALLCLGLSGIKRFHGSSTELIIEPLLNDPEPLTAITAAWALTLMDSPKTQEFFLKWLKNENQETRLFAAGALNATGSHGSSALLTAFHEADDPYVHMTLALGCLSRQIFVEDSCEVLYKGLQEDKTRWDWFEKGPFRALTPSKIGLSDTIPNHPEVVNQMTRLEVLNNLAIVRYPKAQDAIKNFLKERNWGITGMASTLVLTEGDDESIGIIKGLLQHKEEKIRIQSALVLSLWSQEEESLDVLRKAYSFADRETKIKILEAIGRVGTESSIPFLVNVMQDPFQSLRIIAATALLECLYH